MRLELPIENFLRINAEQKNELTKNNLITLKDLLFYFPKKYLDNFNNQNIINLQDGDKFSSHVIIKKIESKRSFKTKKLMTEAILVDSTAQIKAIWLNQYYIGKIYKINQKIKISGQVKIVKGLPVIFNPKILENDKESIDLKNNPIPIYKESRKLTNEWFFHSIDKIIKNKLIETLSETLPNEILKKYHLPTIQQTIYYLHRPRKNEQIKAANKRIGFEEIFYLQLIRQKDQSDLKKSFSFQIKKKLQDVEDILKIEKINLTSGQKKITIDILSDFQKKYPTSRLLEGEVGSGKTLIAILISYAVLQEKNSLQVAYMAPTEILAKQIFANFKKFLKNKNYQIGLLTSKEILKYPSKINPNEETKISKTNMKNKIKNGEIKILIGTQSLIQKEILFENLALVIIDEQHRFGRSQRENLLKKDNNKAELEEIKKQKKIDSKDRSNLFQGRIPHLLLMTATPIPRTLALTILGDLNISILEQELKGRLKPKTKIYTYSEENRNKIFNHLKKNIIKKEQAYVICPRIEETEENNLELISTVKAKKIYGQNIPEARIETLNAKMHKNKKNEIFAKFQNGLIDILISTSIIEVGIDVANASTIIIENAERFGLSQLHQMRGRVVRGQLQPFCFAFYKKNKNEITEKRLDFFEKNFNCFRLAEFDLKLRGPGELLGKNQSGLSDSAMEAMRNLKLVKYAKDEAQNYIESQNQILLEQININKEKIYLD